MSMGLRRSARHILPRWSGLLGRSVPMQTLRRWVAENAEGAG
jgi:hypothetical protein